jgi:uncharacterized protein YidB (DUF937 family)
MAAQPDMFTGQLLPLLAQSLPSIIGGLIPNGRVPAEDKIVHPLR